MITKRPAPRQPTKLRLLEEGVRLFAENGFRETTVGDIEAAAGLEPRRGAMYRHYPSKEALLEAALEAHMQGLGDTAGFVDDHVGDRRDEALKLGRWLLAEVDREHAIVRILEQDGDRLPVLRDRFRQQLVEPGYRLIGDVMRRWLDPPTTAAEIDALSAVLLSALMNYRRSTWTFGRPPAGVSERRFVETWADLCVTAVANVMTARARTSRAR